MVSRDTHTHTRPDPDHTIQSPPDVLSVLLDARPYRISAIHANKQLYAVY